MAAWAHDLEVALDHFRRFSTAPTTGTMQGERMRFVFVDEVGAWPGEDAPHGPDWQQRTQAPPADPRLRAGSFARRGRSTPVRGRYGPSQRS